MTDEHHSATPYPATPYPATPYPAAPQPRRRFRAACAGALTVVGVVAAGLVTAGGVAQAADRPGCTDGPWTLGDISVQGRPDDLAAGARGRTYVWHDADGWHLRSTDPTNAPHHYSGTITPSAGAALVDIRGVRLDPQDRFVVEQDGLHYSFTTHAGVDGVDFRVTGCRQAAPESLTFNLRKEDHGDDPGLIEIGEQGRHPGSDPFTVHRAD